VGRNDEITTSPTRRHPAGVLAGRLEDHRMSIRLSRVVANPTHLTVSGGSFSPVLLTCEHASNRMPWEVRAKPEVERLLIDHWGWDIGAWPVTRAMAACLEAGALGGRWSRLLIDLNRPITDSTLVRQEAGGIVLPWNRRLSPAAVERRVLEYHSPYHAEVDRQVLRRLVRGIRPLLISVHTFTPELGGRRRGFDAGVLFKDHRRLARMLGRGLRDAGLRVRYNEPYSGLAGMMYAVDRHGSHHDLPCLELELNQDLVRTSESVERVASAVAPVLAGTARLATGE
jgi:predicted N-formylglutamate amidohydrolase